MGALFCFVGIWPPFELLCTMLRTVVYGWCTSARFRRSHTGCLLRCGDMAGKCQVHYIVCRVWREWLASALRIPDLVRLGSAAA